MENLYLQTNGGADIHQENTARRLQVNTYF